MRVDYIDGGDVRFVYRQLPVLGAASFRVAEAAECAAEQGGFWAYHDALLERLAEESQGAVSDGTLGAFARGAGLDLATFTACLQSGRNAERVQRDVEAARALNVRSTPTLFISGIRLDGLRDYAVYRRVIEDELAKAR